MRSQTVGKLFQFLARDSIMLLPVRLSVCPSVCPSHGWISRRLLELGSCNFHRRVAPWL